MTTEVFLDGSIIVLKSPYHPDLPAKAKNLGGQFRSSTKVWHFHPNMESRVRELAKEMFGTDGTQEVQLVTVHIDTTGHSLPGNSFWKFGRLIAERRSRDEAVRLGNNVAIISGKFPEWEGSTKNPRIGGKDVILEVMEVPLSLALDAAAEDAVMYSIVDEIEPVSAFDHFSDIELIRELKDRGYVFGDDFYLSNAVDAGNLRDLVEAG